MEMAQYVDLALGWREAGSALPFATVRTADDTVIGSTRFFLLERWAWPAGHPHARRGGFDGCEIGCTWLSASAIRSAANTEANRLASDLAPRDSARYSIVAAEWPQVKQRLQGRLAAHR